MSASASAPFQETLPPELTDETDVEVLGVRALEARESRQPELAVVILERAVQLEPDHEWAWLDLAWSYLAAERFEEGEAAARRQIEINPFQPNAHTALGQLLWPQGQHEEALDAYRSQLEVSPLDAFTHRVLAFRLRDLGRHAEAIPVLERAVQIEPDRVEVRLDLGGSLLNEHRDAGSVRYRP